MATVLVDAGKKRALENRWTIVFLDEAGANLTPVVGKTWAPRGQTPILRHRMGRWTKVNLVSAVTHTDKLYFQLKVDGSFKQPDIIQFLRTLLRHIRGQILLFWDGGGPHRGPVLRRFLKRRPRLRIKPLPPYGFEYNPDEKVWSNLKFARLRNYAAKDTKELTRTLRRHLRQMQRERGLVGSFFQASKLPREGVDLLLNQTGCL